MKKFVVLLVVAAAMLSAAVGVSAEELAFGTAELTLPETYVPEDSSISLMSLETEASSLGDKFLSAWLNLDSTPIDVSGLGLTLNEVSSIYNNKAYNNPRLFYVQTGFNYQYFKGDYAEEGDRVIASVIPLYKTTDAAEIESTLAAIDEETEKILWLLNDNMSDFEKEMTVHDYMALNYNYDTGYNNYDTSIMVTKTGVCQAYALAFKLVMNSAGLDCTYVSSKAMNHAWNLVKLDGEWYHVDVTQDDPLFVSDSEKKIYTDIYGQVRHTYAFLSSSAMEAAGHTGFDLNGLTADSTLYDACDWHNSISSVAYCGGENYYVLPSGSIMSMSGESIYNNLDNIYNGTWYVTASLVSQGGIYSGTAEYNGRLYFNTNKDIRAYNPKDGSVEIIKPASSGVCYCGMYIGGNTLMYTKYDSENKAFVKGGEVSLGDVRICEPFSLDGCTTVKVLAENGAEVKLYAQDRAGVQMRTIKDSRSVIDFYHADAHPTLYFWDGAMKPYIDKKEY